MEVSALKYSGVGLHARSPLLRLQSDERLVTLIRRGNHAAFEVLVGRYSTRLLAFCRHLLGSREDAEDVLQEILAASFNAILADDRPINVRPWLYRIARNRSLNHLRRMQAIGVDSMDVHYSDHGQSTADKVHEREEFRLLVGDIQGLPETQRTALVLREMDALSYEQIAEVMETTVPSVKSLLVRARVSLAEAAEARLLSCDEVRIELGEVAEGLRRRPNPLVRRHLRTCKRCGIFKDQLKETNKALAALMPIGPLVFFKQLLFTHVGHSASAGSGATATGTGASAAGSSAVGAGAAGSTAAGAAGTTAAGVGAVGSSAVGAGAVGSTAAGGILAGSTATGFVSAGVGALATKAAAGLAAAALVTAGAVEVSRSGPTHARRVAWHQKLAGSTAAAHSVVPHGAGHHNAVAANKVQKKAAPAKTTSTATTQKPPAQTTTTSTTTTTTSTTTTPTTTTDATTTTTPTTPTTTTPLPGRTQTQTDPTVLTPPKQPPPVDTTPVVTPTPTPGTTTPTTGTTTVPVTPGPPPPDGSSEKGGSGDGSGYAPPSGGSFFTP